MEDLIRQASEFLEKRYQKPINTVAAALQTKSGKTYLGTNIDHFSGYVCAETSALASAMNEGETEFMKLVAVRRQDDGKIAVANPCGKCRQILHDYMPGVNIAVNDTNGIHTETIETLLPYAFMRQQEKIQQVIRKEGK